MTERFSSFNSPSHRHASQSLHILSSTITLRRKLIVRAIPHTMKKQENKAMFKYNQYAPEFMQRYIHIRGAN